jgi:hypothetical protein
LRQSTDKRTLNDVRGDDDESRPGDGDNSPVGDEPLSLDGLVIPDDARELDADARALQRERRVEARQARVGRFFGGRYGLPGPIVVVILALLAGFASMVLLSQPRRTALREVPLATTGIRPVGAEGGLLPDVEVRRSDGATLRLRDMRPAVLALLPAGCGCDDQLREVGLAAVRHEIDYLLIADEVPPAPADLNERAVLRVAEPTGALARTYNVSRQAGVRFPVLLLVRGDGVVNRVLTSQPSVHALDVELAVLAATGQRAGIR